MSSDLRSINAQEKILKWLWFPEIRRRERSIEDAQEGTYLWLLHEPKLDSKSVLEFDSQSHPLFKPGPHELEQGQGAEVGNANVGPHNQHSATDGWLIVYPVGVSTARQLDTEEIDKKQKRDAFIAWLRSGNNVFYISGKAGSGKSTLMKTLAHNPRTNQLLSTWADSEGKRLIFGRFFFWNSGTRLQQDIEGLYRGILWEILSTCPDLIGDAFPELSRTISTTPLHRLEGVQDKIEIHILQTALDNLFKRQNFVSQYKICLFIDGLDEFSGDYWKIAKQLKGWCNSTDVKICVSSRPYNEFERVFQPESSMWLRLHELTCQDMLRVVRTEFDKDERFTDYLDGAPHEHRLAQKLVETIVERADGVFMWVRLVIHTLLTSMGNSCSIQAVRYMFKRSWMI